MNNLLKVEITDNMINVLNMDVNSGISQNVFVIEEMSELIKELMKEQRQINRIDTDNLNTQHDTVFEEICDVLCTVLIMCYQRGYKTDEIARQIDFKCKRALCKSDKGDEI